MTTSPYDNLPVGPQRSAAGPQEEPLQYVDVNLESAEEMPTDSIANQRTTPESEPSRSASARSAQMAQQPAQTTQSPQPGKQAPAFAKADNASQASEQTPASTQTDRLAQSGKAQTAPAKANQPEQSTQAAQTHQPEQAAQSERQTQPGQRGTLPQSKSQAAPPQSEQPANPAQSTQSPQQQYPADSRQDSVPEPDFKQRTNPLQPSKQAPASGKSGAPDISAKQASNPSLVSAQSGEKAAALATPANPATPPHLINPANSTQPAFAKTTPFDKTPKYDKRSIQNIWGQQEYILPFEESLLVPDTMPDMESILFAEGRVDLTQPTKNSYEKSDSVSGDIILYTVYKPAPDADSPVDVVKSSIAFKTDKCWDKAEGDDFRVTVTIKNISAEMINERKFIARGQLLITFTEIAKKELMVFSGSDDPNLVQSDGHICVTGLDFETDETTEISQEINCREEQPAPIKILKESIRIVETHRQITSGKLVINASIHSQILYLGEKDGEQKLSCTMNKTDFTQFVRIDDSADTDRMKITFRGNNLKIKIESHNKFLLHGQVTTLIQGYKNQEIPIARDAYHKNSEIKFDINTQALSAIIDTVIGEISAREVIAPGETDKKPETLLCGSCHIASIEGHLERDRIIIEGTMPVKILALDEENTPFLIENSIPLRGSLEMPSAAEDVTLCISSELKEFWFDEINSRQMEINASISLNIWALGKEIFKSLENLCFVETKEPARRISMALYVVGAGDTLWDVAKKYKSDMNMLAELNQIDPQKPLSEGMKLLVAK